MIKFHDIEQNTDEWFALRAGKLTGSGFSKIMANYGKAFGEPAKKYAADIAVSQITGKPQQSGYSNAHMERGHEQEPLARMKYEEENFVNVSNGGFFESGFIGVSPDGCAFDGLIEIKSVISSVHYTNITRAKFDPAYKWQLIGNMKYTEKPWIDFISYCLDFPEDKQIYTYRMHEEHFKKEYEMMDSRVDEFESLVYSTKKKILSSSYNLESGQ